MTPRHAAHLAGGLLRRQLRVQVLGDVLKNVLIVLLGALDGRGLRGRGLVVVLRGVTRGPALAVAG